MMTITCVQILFLLSLAFESECTVEIIRPLGTLQIQPLLVDAIYNEDTNMTSYIILFSGPSDTKEENGIPLFEVYRSPNFSVFRAEKQVVLKEIFRIKFSSASTSESFRILLRGRSVSGTQREFDAEACIFEIEKETNEHVTKYSVNDNECQLKQEEDLHIWDFLTVTFIDDKERRYEDYDEAMKEYVNNTNTNMSLNVEKMKKDGIKLFDASYRIMIVRDSRDNILSYDWNVNLI